MKETISFNHIYQWILAANNEIRSLNVGAGTTICVGFIDDNKLTFFNTGDSNGIHISGKGNTKTQTTDQSSAGLAIASDLFSESEIRQKDGGNQLIHALGDEILNLSICGPMEINTRDNILISSDGLTANLSNDDINQAITQGTLNERVQSLVELTHQKMNSPSGHHDDLTILLFTPGRSDSIENPET